MSTVTAANAPVQLERGNSRKGKHFKQFERASYCSPCDTNCKPSVRRNMLDRRHRREREERKRLLRGMEVGPCYLITITQGRGLYHTLRRDIWHPVLTRMTQRWPSVEAWTVIEFAKRRGVHLHAVVRGTPGIACEWVAHIVSLPQMGYQVDLRPVDDPDGLAEYLTKDLRNSAICDGWPQHFRPVSATRGWSPCGRVPQRSGACTKM